MAPEKSVIKVGIISLQIGVSTRGREGKRESREWGREGDGAREYVCVWEEDSTLAQTFAGLDYERGEKARESKRKRTRVFARVRERERKRGR